ncbi:MAG: DUF4446 family protein [Lachnospiraceae bacterium]|nr:DUF4446 family protein [Lachnospiraceae bacterium]
MNSNILNSLGMGSMDPGIFVIIAAFACVLALVLLILLCVQASKVKKLSGRLDRLCAGAAGESLEEKLGQIIEENQYLSTTVEEHKGKIKDLYRRQEKDLQKTAMVRYDAFSQLGGQLSYALAVLDQHDDGFLLNVVHSSEGSYSYAKQVEAGACKLELSEEEARALEQAKAVKL